MPARAHFHRPGRHMPPFFSSLRLRLMLWYLLILGIVLCAFSAVIYFTEEHTLYQSLDTILTGTISHLASSYDPQAGFQDLNAPDILVVLQNPQGEITLISSRSPLEPLAELRSDLSQIQSWESGYLWGNSHRAFGSPHDSGLLFTSAGEPVFTKLGDGSFYALKRVRITNQQNQLQSLLYVGISSDDVVEQSRQLLATLVIVTPLVLLFSSAGGYWLAERATRPIQTMTRTAQEISATDLHRRLNLKQRDEMGELATTFDGMLDRLERAFERQQQFTADASHELRTPLSIVNTEVERVLQRPHPSQEYVQVLSIIYQENQRMTRLVSDLLILARADQGRTVLKQERVDLSEILVDAAEYLSSQAVQNGIEFRLSGLDELVILGDRIYLTHLCTNLLDNAIKYSTGVGKYVEVKLEQEPGQARLQIIDEGPGIEATHLPHIFERFYRVDQSRQHTYATGNGNNPSGSGLGLSIARWIAQEHGGSIQVQSSPGKGSIFEVCLPLN